MTSTESVSFSSSCALLLACSMNVETQAWHSFLCSLSDPQDKCYARLFLINASATRFLRLRRRRRLIFSKEQRWSAWRYKKPVKVTQCQGRKWSQPVARHYPKNRTVRRRISRRRRRHLEQPVRHDIFWAWASLFRMLVFDWVAQVGITLFGSVKVKRMRVNLSQ